MSLAECVVTDLKRKLTIRRNMEFTVMNSDISVYYLCDLGEMISAL